MNTIEKRRPIKGIPNVTKGKSLSDWYARTYCNFGNTCCRAVIHTHYSEETARRGFKKLLRSFNPGYQRPGNRLWLETIDGRVLEEITFAIPAGTST